MTGAPRGRVINGLLAIVKLLKRDYAALASCYIFWLNNLCGGID